CGHDNTSNRNGVYSPSSQFADKLVGRPFPKRLLLASLGPVKERAVFGNNAIEQIHSMKNSAEIVEFSPGDQNQFPPGLLHVDKRLDRALVHTAVQGNCAVVVAC